MGKAVTITGLALAGADAGDYALPPTAAATASISALPITVTAASDTKVYDGTTSSAAAPSITSGGLAPGDSAGFTEAFDTKGAGTGKTLTPSGSVVDGNGGADYAVSFVADTTGAITPAGLTVTGITAADKTYDGTTTATIDTSAASLVGVVPGDAVTLDASGATASFANKHAGTGKVVTITGLALAGADAGDYTLPPTATATASIHPATLTVRANDVSRPFAQSNPSFTASYSGFVGGDTLATSDVSGSPSLTTSAAPLSPAGSYPIQAGTGSLTSNDYTFALVPGTLTVTPSTIPSSVATSTQGQSSVGSAVCGQPVTFVAHVTSSVAGLDPTGTVVFLDGSTVIGTSPLVGSTATLTTANLGVGAHQIRMSYSGEGVFQPSQSAPISVTVAPAFTATTLIVQPAAGGHGYLLVAHVVPVPPGAGTPTGSVVFSFNRKAFRTVKLTNGEAQVFVSARNALRRWFTASYRNAPNIFNMSISNTVYVGRPKPQPMQRPLGSARANLVVGPAAPGGLSPSSASGGGTHGAAARLHGPVRISARPAFSGRSPRSGPAR
jgi:hypothetical protein